MRQDEQASKKAEGSEKYVCLETEKSINKTHAKICNKNLRNERKDRDREREEKKKEISKQNICYALVIFSHEGRAKAKAVKKRRSRGGGNRS